MSGSVGKSTCVGSFSALGNLGGKKEECVLLKEGPLVGATSLLDIFRQTSLLLVPPSSFDGLTPPLVNLKPFFE